MSGMQLWWIFSGVPPACNNATTLVVNGSSDLNCTTYSPGWYASVTMIFGSIIGGATAEGGGAVAFPVFSLVMGLSPLVARNFTLMIQTIGMGSAALLIQYMQLQICNEAVIFSSLGSIIGLIIGIAWIVPLLTPASMKLFFVTFFFGFRDESLHFEFGETTCHPT